MQFITGISSDCILWIGSRSIYRYQRPQQYQRLLINVAKSEWTVGPYPLPGEDIAVSVPYPGLKLDQTGSVKSVVSVTLPQSSHESFTKTRGLKQDNSWPDFQFCAIISHIQLLCQMKCCGCKLFEAGTLFFIMCVYKYNGPWLLIGPLDATTIPTINNSVNRACC